MTWGEDEWTPQRWVKKVLWKRQSNATFYLRLLMVLWMLRWVHVCLFVSCHHWPWYGPLTYQRQILLYVLSQVSIHYLPVEDVLRQLRLLVVYVLLKSCFLLFFFFFLSSCFQITHHLQPDVRLSNFLQNISRCRNKDGGHTITVRKCKYHCTCS